MKKSKITAIALMVLAVAACKEEGKPTESAAVQPTESAVVQPQAVEQVKTTVQTQAVESRKQHRTIITSRFGEK